MREAQDVLAMGTPEQQLLFWRGRLRDGERPFIACLLILTLP